MLKAVEAVVSCLWIASVKAGAAAPRVHAAPQVPLALGVDAFINATVDVRATLTEKHGDPCSGRGRRLDRSSVLAAFTNIYDTGYWGGNTTSSVAGRGAESHGGSGAGSMPSAGFTAGVALLRVIIEFKATRVLDAPSGALAWQRDVMAAIHQLYNAVDVVESVVKRNQHVLQRISGSSHWAQASQVELSSDPTPTDSDVILCRDALQHLDEPSIRKVLRNFCSSGAPLLLVGGFGDGANQKSKVGGMMHLNLRKKPYGFDGPELLQIFHERRPHLEQHMGKDKTPQVLMLYDLPKLCVKMDVP